MDETQVKHVVEAALLAAGRPLSLEKLASLFAGKASELDKETLQKAIDALASDYKDRGLELKEVSTGYRIQIRRSMSDWLTPLWEERVPRYTRALLETLALVAYRQPITRAEIEEVRGVAVSTNIMRTLLERSWVRVVGHRDVPGKPAMFGTTKEFLDYFGLKKLEDLPPLADVKDGFPELTPQSDLIDALEIGEEESTLDGEASADRDPDGEASAERSADGDSGSAAAPLDDAQDEADDDSVVQESGGDDGELAASVQAEASDEDDDELAREHAGVSSASEDDDDEVQAVVAHASGSADDEADAIASHDESSDDEVREADVPLSRSESN